MSEEGFLSRWSRRKRAAQQRPHTPEEPLQQPGAAGRNSPNAIADTPIAEIEPELSAEEIALLPRVEDLTAKTDLTQFLRKGVPQALRNAALRRAWALDPAIRDYVGEAREYAYDWNTPGGVPGFGELAPDETRALLQRVIGKEESPASALLRPARDEPIPDSNTDDADSARPPIGDDRERGASSASAAEPETAPASRRHGGALPI